MTLLSRYLLRNNLFLLFSILLVGTGLYVLTDLFERLDGFLDASFGLMNIAWFYAIKIPLIVGQILPAVFLIAVIVQFSLMAKARELVALQSGGVSPFAFLRFVILCGLFWAVAQLALTQLLGIEGDKLSTRIWKERVRGNEVQETSMRGLWFVEKSYVVHLALANPGNGTGKGFLAYQLSEDDKHLRQMIRAESFTVRDRVWRLHNATVITPESYGYETRPEMTIPLTQDITAFLAIDPGTKPTHLPIWSLHKAIADLETSGSNVEVLRTTMHSRFAYAASLIVMGMIGLAIVLWRNNVYLAVAVGLLVTFIFYACTTLFISFGEKGVLSPVVAGWFPVCLFFLLSLGAVLMHIRPKFGQSR
ncbi:LptF/LptG family permease [Desulfovibrio sp. OttesenSCG-928-O18]|nr:LptF/LptG family permease [Desulfovibrio sp. OttesenSCG-928-O18]